jgi:hypothetical protein
MYFIIRTWHPMMVKAITQDSGYKAFLPWFIVDAWFIEHSLIIEVLIIEVLIITSLFGYRALPLVVYCWCLG